jgi:hypothetical protein
MVSKKIEKDCLPRRNIENFKILKYTPKYNLHKKI